MAHKVFISYHHENNQKRVEHLKVNMEIIMYA